MDTITKEKLFGSLDISKIDRNPDFKEDSVREEIILPILKELGYSHSSIIRSKSLQHPFVKIGSTKKPVTIIPDYAMKIDESYAWVLDAKSPDEKVNESGNLEQVFSYAIHPEIRSNYFAVCNGKQFIAYRPNTEKPVLFFSLDEIEYHWDEMKKFLSLNSFQAGKKFVYEPEVNYTARDGFDYKNRPLPDEIPVKKRAAKRHFGIHGYFTKQTWNVVGEYIRNFSKPGDLVLDPFAGSGVTGIEALMNNRRAINIDLNPLAVFIVNSLIEPVNYEKLSTAFERVRNKYVKEEPNTKKEIESALRRHEYPKGIRLPKGSDVSVVEDLFSDKQIAQLAVLQSIINEEKSIEIRNSLLLMFSGLVTKVNLTYHTGKVATKDGQGNASAFQYYRIELLLIPKTLM